MLWKKGHARRRPSSGFSPPSSFRWACGPTCILPGRLPAEASGGPGTGSRCQGREEPPGGAEAISKVIVEQGTVQTTNIPIADGDKPAGMKVRPMARRP